MNHISQHNRKALRQDSVVVRGPRTLIWAWLACALACVTFATPDTVQAIQQSKSDKSGKFGKSGKSGKRAPIANGTVVSEEGVIYACYIPKQGSVYRIREAGLRDQCFARKHVAFSFNTEGPAGPAGADGAPGADGADGADGAPGADGNDGAPGADGLDGAPGADGLDGAPGADGNDGADGADGNDGADGADGNDGADGADGNDGKDGVSGYRLLSNSFTVPPLDNKLGQFTCGNNPDDRVFGGGYEVTGADSGYFVVRNAPNGNNKWIVWIRNTNATLTLTVAFHAICGKG